MTAAERVRNEMPQAPACLGHEESSRIAPPGYEEFEDMQK